MFKKFGSLVLGIIAVVGLAACTDLGTSVSGYYVSVDINPSIEFVVTGNDIVESYIFLNEDAEILCADLDFTGMNVDDAVELFIQTATEAGYIDPEGNDNAVLITVLGEEGQETEVNTIRERIRSRAIKHFARNLINAEVITEDFTQEDLVAQAAELGVTPGKLKLSLAAMANDDTLVLEELLVMPVKDILAIVKEAHTEEWDQYKETRMNQMRNMKQEMVQEHKAEIDAYLAENPDLTDEEIQAYIEEHKEAAMQEARDQWQERVQNWKNNRNGNHGSETPNPDSTETDPVTDDTQTS